MQIWREAGRQSSAEEAGCSDPPQGWKVTGILVQPWLSAMLTLRTTLASQVYCGFSRLHLWMMSSEETAWNEADWCVQFFHMTLPGPRTDWPWVKDKCGLVFLKYLNALFHAFCLLQSVACSSPVQTFILLKISKHAHNHFYLFKKYFLI